MHGACYRKGNGQPYANTRHIKGKPQIKIAKFNSGNTKRQFEYCVQLMINEKVQIRHMALESTRLAANKTPFIIVPSRHFSHFIINIDEF